MVSPIYPQDLVQILRVYTAQQTVSSQAHLPLIVLKIPHHTSTGKSQLATKVHPRSLWPPWENFPVRAFAQAIHSSYTPSLSAAITPVCKCQIPCSPFHPWHSWERAQKIRLCVPRACTLPPKGTFRNACVLRNQPSKFSLITASPALATVS